MTGSGQIEKDAPGPRISARRKTKLKLPSHDIEWADEGEETIVAHIFA